MAAEPAKNNASVKDVVSYFNSLTRPNKKEEPKKDTKSANVVIPRVKLKNYRNEMFVKSVTEDENFFPTTFDLTNYARSSMQNISRSSKPDLVLRSSKDNSVDAEMLKILEELTGRLSEYDKGAKGFVVRPQVKRRLRRINSNSRKFREGIIVPKR